MTEDNHKVIRHTLTQLLSRREHGFNELIFKLEKKGFNQDDFLPVLHQFKQANIQSDSRFVEMHYRAGISKGQGPTRIKEVLKQHKIEDSDLFAGFSDIDVDWFDLAWVVKCKKFGELPPKDTKEKAKQQRFLLYRGFSYEHIEHALTNEVNS